MQMLLVAAAWCWLLAAASGCCWIRCWSTSCSLIAGDCCWLADATVCWQSVAWSALTPKPGTKQNNRYAFARLGLSSYVHPSPLDRLIRVWPSHGKQIGPYQAVSFGATAVLSGKLAEASHRIKIASNTVCEQPYHRSYKNVARI
jgi:hypothetical protein